MNLLVSKVTQKYQATIPAEVRRVLGIGRGDSLAFAIEDGKVLLRRATPLDREFANTLQSTLEKWSSPHDEAAYREL